MARIRSIKPEFWTSEQVMELSRDARGCFIGMWNFCDDAGIHPASPKRLKAEVFPADDLTAADVRRLVDECINVGLVEEYQVGDESFWIVTGWHHQKIDKPTFQHPRPDGSVPEGAAKRRVTRINTQNSTTTRVGVGEDSSNGSRELGEASPPESSRVESKGVEVNLKTIGATGVNGKPAPEDPDAPLGAAGIAKSLIGWERERNKAARGISASQQQVIDLAEMLITPDELRKAYDMAVADRLATEDPMPINAGFVKSFVVKVRNPPKPRAPRDDWSFSNEGIDRKARELGMRAIGNESYASLKTRLFEEIRKRAGVAA